VLDRGIRRPCSIASGVIFTLPALIFLGRLAGISLTVVFAIAGAGRSFGPPLLGTAAPLGCGRAEDELPRRAGGRGSPESGSGSRPGSQDPRGLCARRRRHEIRRGEWARLIPDTAQYATYVAEVDCLLWPNLSPGASLARLHRRLQHRATGSCSWGASSLEHRHSIYGRFFSFIPTRCWPPPFPIMFGHRCGGCDPRRTESANLGVRRHAHRRRVGAHLHLESRFCPGSKSVTLRRRAPTSRRLCCRRIATCL